jgi:hypothetical protein
MDIREKVEQLSLRMFDTPRYPTQGGVLFVDLERRDYFSRCLPINVLSNSFRPERALFRPGCVNLQDSLCGVRPYASAQSLDFLARTKNFTFPNRKLIVPHPEFPDGN